ncbi:MAG: PKD domain-containing protein [Saprospiraceae bacterium]|nr:PKD domain-containing protein [Saprospiraceae bacterium]
MRWIYILIGVMYCATALDAQVTVAFVADRTEGCGIFQVNFTDQSTSTAGNIVQWEWNLGGQLSNVQHPGRIFNETGAYDICLTVTDDQGNTGTLCLEDHIRVFALPIVDFAADPVAGCAPLEVTFTDLSQSQNGSIVERIWGVGGTAGVVIGGSEVASLVNEYVVPDLYSPSLTVRDEKGCVNTRSYDDLIRVGGIPPMSITASDSFACTAPLDVTFSLDNPVPGLTYFWDFSASSFTGVQPPVVTYASNGVYDVTLIAYDPVTDCRDTLTVQQAVIVGLAMDPQADSYDFCLGNTVTLTDTVPVPGATYLWEFGDGNTSTQATATHTYAASGCYTVRLTKFVDGCSRTLTLPQCVRVVEQPVVELTADKSVSCIVPASFNLQASSPTLSDFQWQIANSGPVNGTAVTIPSDTFGLIPVLLTGFASSGCVTEVRDTLYIGDLDVSIPSIVSMGCVPYSATLSGQVLDGFDIVSWDWTIHTSPPLMLSGPSPTFTLDDAGRFDVTLAVTSAEGCVDSIRVTDLVTGGTPPDISFTASPLLTCVDTVVEFTGIVNGSVDEFYWDFGDGAHGFVQNPTHEYQDTGFFTVTFTATWNGCAVSDSIVDYIYILPPIARFMDSVYCGIDTVVLTSQAIAADSLLWNWSRDSIDLGTSTDSIAAFALDTPGTYIASLTVWNGQTGCVDVRRDTIVWEEVRKEPVLDPLSGCAPLTVNVNDGSTGIVSWEWMAPGAEVSDTFSATPQLTFTEPGKYTGITIITEDLNACRDTLVLSDTIVANRLIPGLVLSDPISCEGTVMTLTDSSETLFGDIVAWSWVIGDSALVLTGDSVALALDSAGIYGITLHVTDDLGCTRDTAIADTLVIVDPVFLPQFDTLTCPGAEVLFRVPGSLPGVKYNWSYGDGSTAIGRVVGHIYDSIGTYEVCVSLYDTPGCDSVVCRNITVIEPVADFAADTLFSNCPPLVVNFSNLSANASVFLWNFGDNSGASSLSDPAHVYTRPGVFDVQLIAGFNAQCLDTLLRPEYIRLDGPEGEFSFEVDDTCLPVQASFVGTSVDLYDYIWDYGDGLLDSSETRVMIDSVSHVYEVPGAFVPRLILIDTENCLRSFTSDTIFVRDVVRASITAALVVCIGDTLQLSATLDQQVDGLTYTWLGDPAVACDTCLVTYAVPDTSAGYAFVTMHPNGCVSGDSITVEVQPLPTVMAASLDSLTCHDAEVRLTVSADPGGTVLWDVPPGASCNDCSAPVLPPGTEGSFAVMVVDSFGCIGRDTARVRIFRDTVDFLIPDKTICAGDTTVLSVSGVIDPVWAGSTALSCTSCPDPAAFPLSDVLITVTAQHPVGCTVHDTLALRVLDQSMIAAGDDRVICAGEIIELIGQSPVDTVTWQPATAVIGQNGSTVEVAPDSTTVFVLTAVSDECVLSDSLTIEVLYETSIEASGDEICPGDTALLIATGDAEIYQWFAADGTPLGVDSTGMLPFHPSASAAVYVVGYRSVCAPDTADVTITVFDPVVVDLPGELVVYPGEQVRFDLGLVPPDQYLISWNPASGFSCNDCVSPMVTIDSTREIAVHVIDTETGCEARDTTLLRIPRRCLDEFIHVPNVFSPNGDGVNDVLPLYSAKHQAIHSFRIYDRWGNQVFETDDIAIPWDGTFRGEAAPPGVYVYVLDVPCIIDGSSLILSGDVTLIR